jgi:N-acetylmuramoyl-L-alanine amidase
MNIAKNIQFFIKPLIPFLIGLYALTGCGVNDSNLKDRVICIDPGHGGTAMTDSFRIGPSGEREEWMNLRVALELKTLLESKNYKVILTRTADEPVTLQNRAELANKNKADVFVSIHHNATADSTVNFPIVYFHGNASENQASVQLGKSAIKFISKVVYNDNTEMSLVSDYTIFPNSGTAVLRHSYGIPGIIGEASFFTHPAEEKRLKSKIYNNLEAQAYFMALEEYFSIAPQPIVKKFSVVQIPAFPVLQERDRMDPIALFWQDDYKQAVSLFNQSDNISLQKSFDLFTRSVRSFPDSWLAGSAHAYRAKILIKQRKKTEAIIEEKRILEYYVNLD